MSRVFTRPWLPKQASVMRVARRWHDRLMWPAAFALACWAISGLTHPLMSWLGPDADTMRPPQASFSAQTWAQNLPPALALEAIEGAPTVVPTAQGAMLRVSVPDERVALYFQQGTQQPYTDADHALWLAQHYLGEARTKNLQARTLFTEFTTSYPSVNRLLPVWRVEFDDSLHAFVHTETGSLATMGGQSRLWLQPVFQWLHTHSYLSQWPWLQFVWSLALVSALVVFAIAGTVLVFAMPKRKSIQPGARRWHRRGALLLYVPLLALSLSGAYHLVYTHFATKEPGQRLVDLEPVAQESALALLDGLAAFDGIEVQQSSMVRSPDGSHYIRLQHIRDEAPTSREERFAGHASYTDVSYLGGAGDMDDKSMALNYVRTVRSDAPEQFELVTRFGGLYDFRNKRLPVWQASYADEVIFIDPARQVVVERVARAEQWERWVFSQLHKWNFMTPWIGRSNRDILVSMVAIALLLMLGLGIQMSRRRKR